MKKKDIALNTLSDLVADYLYYDRKDDEDLPRGAIQTLIEEGDLKVEIIVAHFKKILIEFLEAAEEKKREAEKWTCNRCGYINIKPDPALKISDSALGCYECQQWFKEN